MASAEYQALYGGLVDNGDFIDQVYSNSFARAADPGGARLLASRARSGSEPCRVAGPLFSLTRTCRPARRRT
ncbi:MAG: DUF4214 domain-containing protein [Porticoccaceae bacterium]|nr:DUF4214 domain-containing protein [Porticoccaceae bacterium]